MSKEEALKLVRGVYWPDIEYGFKEDELSQKIEELYSLNVGSIEYLKLKNEVMINLADNIIEELSREKRTQAMENDRLYRMLKTDLGRMEMEE